MVIGLSGTALAWHAQGPGFDPYHYIKKKEKWERFFIKKGAGDVVQA